MSSPSRPSSPEIGVVKRRAIALAAAATLSCATTIEPTVAPTVESEPAPYSGLYAGVKAGPLEFSNDIGFDNGTNLGFLLGYVFPDTDFAIETELTGTVSDAESDSGAFGDLTISTFAVYGVYRTPGKVYFKGKAGILSEYIQVDFAGLPFEGYGTGLSFGLGGGIRITDRISTELEYTLIESDVDFISLGLNFSF